MAETVVTNAVADAADAIAVYWGGVVGTDKWSSVSDCGKSWRVVDSSDSWGRVSGNGWSSSDHWSRANNTGHSRSTVGGNLSDSWSSGVSDGWGSSNNWSGVHVSGHSRGSVSGGYPGDRWYSVSGDSWRSVDGVAGSWSISVAKAVSSQSRVANAMVKTVVGEAEAGIAKTIAEAISTRNVSSEGAGGQGKEDADTERRDHGAKLEGVKMSKASSDECPSRV